MIPDVWNYWELINELTNCKMCRCTQGPTKCQEIYFFNLGLIAILRPHYLLLTLKLSNFFPYVLSIRNIRLREFEGSIKSLESDSSLPNSAMIAR